MNSTAMLAVQRPNLGFLVWWLGRQAAGRGVDDSGARRAFYARFVRPPTGKHFTSSPTGVSVLNSNPDFDGDCIKQHDFGVARAKSARLQGYTKYLHKELTARELEMLRLDAANMRDANRKLAMARAAFGSRAAWWLGGTADVAGVRLGPCFIKGHFSWRVAFD